jgi:hypothetical protein
MFAIAFFEEKFVWAAHPPKMKISLRDITDSDAVFITGKLMDPEFVRDLTGHYVPFTPAVARNYSRGERGRGKHKTLLLEPMAGGMALGTLLFKLSTADQDALDRFEHVPGLRKRVPIRVAIGATERIAQTFLLRE